MESTRFILAILMVFYATNVIGHSYLTNPISRSNQRSTNSGCRGPACLGPCDIPRSKTTRAPIIIARGESISVQWPRNNHAGGFIRLAWTQTSGSDSHANFDNGVQVIVCHEVGGCGPNSKSDPNGGDSGPANGSSRACQTTIQVPTYLTDGAWTLQWAWFGGAFALGDYYSCVDYTISGGPSGGQSAAVFIGGDYTYPGQDKCKFFNTDRLHRCVNEPCNNPVYPGGERSGPAFGVASQGSTTTSSSQSPSTTAARSLTTSAPSRLTTKQSVVPAQTTGSATTTTGGSGSVSSTTTTGNAQPVANCASLTNVVSDTVFTISRIELWSSTIRMEVKMEMKQNVPDWMVQVIWPKEATNTQISTVYNVGVLRCSANSPTRHSMISPASWAKSLRKGMSYNFEFTASNTNMNAEFLKANIQFIMYKP